MMASIQMEAEMHPGWFPLLLPVLIDAGFLSQTALHLAARNNQHLMVADLIGLGANANEKDASGRTCLHICAERGYIRVLEVGPLSSLVLGIYWIK